MCFTNGTLFAVKGLVSAGRTYENSSSIRKACSFLLSKQLSTGGWGETYPSSANAVILDLLSDPELVWGFSVPCLVVWCLPDKQNLRFDPWASFKSEHLICFRVSSTFISWTLINCIILWWFHNKHLPGLCRDWTSSCSEHCMGNALFDLCWAGIHRTLDIAIHYKWNYSDVDFF